MARHLDDELLDAQNAMDRRHEEWRAELEGLFAGVMGLAAASTGGVVAPEEGRARPKAAKALVETIIESPVKGPPPVVVPLPDPFKDTCKPPPLRFVPLPKSPSWMVPASKQPPPPRPPPPPLVQGERKAPPPALLLASKLDGASIQKAAAAAAAWPRRKKGTRPRTKPATYKATTSAVGGVEARGTNLQEAAAAAAQG